MIKIAKLLDWIFTRIKLLNHSIVCGIPWFFTVLNVTSLVPTKVVTRISLTLLHSFLIFFLNVWNFLRLRKFSLFKIFRTSLLVIFTTGMNEPLTHSTKIILYDEFTSEILNSQGQLRLITIFVKLTCYFFVIFDSFLSFDFC